MVPFVGRNDECIKFKEEFLSPFIMWSERAHYLFNYRKNGSELYKEEGFNFTASGIGKSTCARKVFKYLNSLIENPKDTTDEFIHECVSKKLLFRIHYVDVPATDYEKSYALASLGLRVLYEYLVKRYKSIRTFESFREMVHEKCGQYMKTALTGVLRWIAEREKAKSFVIHLDETNFIKEDNFLLDIMIAFYNAMLEHFLVVVMSGTDVDRLINKLRGRGFATYKLHL